MKKSLFMLLLLINAILVSAQITLQHTYTNADVSSYHYLSVAQLEVSGTKYIGFNMNIGVMKLYNLDHSLYKSIPLAVTDTNANTVYYVSEHLFDLDDGIEYLFLSGNTPAFIKVMDEDGSVLWSESDCNPPCLIAGGGLTDEVAPIYNTDSGTIMIIHVYDSFGNGGYSKIKIYSLPGTLSNEIAQTNGELMKNTGQFSNLYPNPSNGTITLKYELPNGETEGEIILYNLQGSEVKRYKVDNTFKDILLDNTQLPAGTYFYQLQTAKGVAGTKKMILVK